MFLCDKTLNPNETKGLNVLGCCPLQQSITNSLYQGFAQSHQLPHAASSV